MELSRKADDFFSKLDKNIKDRMKKGLKKLKFNPVPNNTKFIGRHKGDKVFRVRIGDYRTLYKIKEDKKIVLITKIDKRSRVYNR
ncbi:type II toxin-antitoxin system RelE/ParE family toxin [Candidatus Woesearchaeota archaeon]|nr:type II toxin-antitoxin system RelE/ParE family toxin [Candidatus Woesearchaeota archaeon]